MLDWKHNKKQILICIFFISLIFIGSGVFDCIYFESKYIASFLGILGLFLLVLGMVLTMMF